MHPAAIDCFGSSPVAPVIFFERLVVALSALLETEAGVAGHSWAAVLNGLEAQMQHRQAEPRRLCPILPKTFVPAMRAARVQQDKGMDPANIGAAIFSSPVGECSPCAGALLQDQPGGPPAHAPASTAQQPAAAAAQPPASTAQQSAAASGLSHQPLGAVQQASATGGLSHVPPSAVQQSTAHAPVTGQQTVEAGVPSQVPAASAAQQCEAGDDAESTAAAILLLAAATDAGAPEVEVPAAPTMASGCRSGAGVLLLPKVRALASLERVGWWRAPHFWANTHTTPAGACRYHACSQTPRHRSMHIT